jgi:S-layer protein
MSGIEKFYVQTDGTSDLNLASVTGLTKVYVDDDGDAANTTLTDLVSDVDVELTSAATATLVVDLLDKTNAANALNLKLNTTVGTSNIDIADVETLTVNVDEAASVNFDGLSMTTTGKTSSLVVTGDSLLTLTALHADVTTIDASASTGGLTQSASSVTAASTITGSSAADTLIMANAGDAIDAGEGADTLDVNFTSVIGGMSIDLSATGDQITTFNGAANAAVQTGFQHVDLSGYTGNGAEITANDSGSTITGTASTDSITLGAGIDKVYYTAATQFATTDTVAGYTVNTDIMQFNSALIGNGDTTIDGFNVAASIVAGANGEIVVVTTALANDAAIITDIQKSTDTTPALFVVYNTADAETQVWYDDNPNIDGNEVQIMTLAGITDAGMDALLVGDFNFV